MVPKWLRGFFGGALENSVSGGESGFLPPPTPANAMENDGVGELYIINFVKAVEQFALNSPMGEKPQVQAMEKAESFELVGADGAAAVAAAVAFSMFSIRWSSN
jgi:hypothetical protein